MASTETNETEDGDRRLTAQGLERKQQLLDCAATLFAERGYADTRIKDIVDAAGVAKGLFYWYFDTKETLFRELTANIRLRLRQHQGAAIDPDASPLTQIHQGTRASVSFMADHAQFFSLLEVERGDAELTSILRAGTDEHLDDVERLIRLGQRAGEIIEDDPRLLAIGVVGAVGYFSHYRRTGRVDRDVEELGRFVAASVVRTLAATEAHALATLRPS